VFKAHRLLYHSALGLRVIKKKRRVKDAEVRIQLVTEALSEEALQGYLTHKEHHPPRTTIGP